MRPWLKLVIEAGPLVVFFLINGRKGFPEFRHLWLAEGQSLWSVRPCSKPRAHS